MPRISQIFVTVVLGAAGSLLAVALQKDILTTILAGAAAVAIAVLIIYIYERYPKYLGLGNALAASVLVFRDDEILLVYSDRQKRWIPPGTHVRRGEQPHRAAIRGTREDSGYDIKYHEWHRREESIDRLVTQVPQPFYVQLERQLPGEGHITHYDFIYVGCVETENPTRGNTNHKWVSLSALNSEDTYPDVIRIARLAFNELASK